IAAHVELDEPANGERGAAIRRGDGWAPLGHAELDRLGGSGRLRRCDGLRRLRFGDAGPDCVLPSPLRGRLSMERLFLRALRLASRLTQLLFGVSQLALEALQLTLQISNLPFDRVDSLDRGGRLCGGVEG